MLNKFHAIMSGAMAFGVTINGAMRMSLGFKEETLQIGHFDVSLKNWMLHVEKNIGCYLFRPWVITLRTLVGVKDHLPPVPGMIVGVSCSVVAAPEAPKTVRIG